MSIDSYNYENNSYSNNTSSINMKNIFEKKEKESLNFDKKNDFINESLSFLSDSSSVLGIENIFSCQHKNCTKKIFIFLSIKNRKNYIEFLCEDNHRNKIEISEFIQKISLLLIDDYVEDQKINKLKKDFKIIEDRKYELEKELQNQINIMEQSFIKFKTYFEYHLILIRLKRFFIEEKSEDIFSNIIEFQNFINLNENFSSNLIYHLSSYDNFINFINNFYNLPLSPSKISAKDNEKFESIKEKINKKQYSTLKINTFIYNDNEKNIFNYNINSICKINLERFAIGFDNGKIIIRYFNSFDNLIEINEFENMRDSVNHLFYSEIHNYIISSWSNYSIRIFKIFMNEYSLIQELKNENNNIKINQTIELINNNYYLVSCDEDKRIIFWIYKNEKYSKEKEIKTEGFINSILYLNKNKEIVFTLQKLKKIQFLNIESNSIEYSINNNYCNCSNNLFLLNQEFLVVKGKITEGIYIIDLQTHSIINQILIGRTVNSFCKIKDNFILSSEYNKENNSCLYLYKYEISEFNIIDSKYNINKNYINSIISNGNFIITSSYDKIHYWSLLEENVDYNNE